MATTAYVNGQVIDGRGKVYQGYRGASFQGNASVIWRAIQSAVG
jgi:hypothetical protein